MEKIEVFAAGSVFVGADKHFLGATPAGNEPDACFYQAEISFRGGLNAGTVQAKFAAAAEGHALRGDDDGLWRVLNGEVDVLELLHGEMQIVPFLLLRGDEDEHEIGADG